MVEQPAQAITGVTCGPEEENQGEKESDHLVPTQSTLLHESEEVCTAAIVEAEGEEPAAVEDDLQGDPV